MREARVRRQASLARAALAAVALLPAAAPAPAETAAAPALAPAAASTAPPATPPDEIARLLEPGPVPAPGEFDRGRTQYHRTCAPCHGLNLVNAGVTTYDLRRFPPDQPERFLASVSKGKGNMPAWENALDFDQIKALWAYVSNHGRRPE